jgi:hypothetical protein
VEPHSVAGSGDGVAINAESASSDKPRCPKHGHSILSGHTTTPFSSRFLPFHSIQLHHSTPLIPSGRLGLLLRSSG